MKSTPQNEIAYLSLPNKKTGSSETIPFLPNAQFEQLKAVQKNLPEALRRDNAVKTLTAELKAAEEELKIKGQEKDVVQKELNQLKAEENNGLKFSEFKRLADSKTKDLTIWKNAQANREKKIAGKIKEAPVAATPAKQPEEVAEMLPGQEFLSILSSDALILLKGADKDPGNFFSKLKS